MFTSQKSLLALGLGALLAAPVAAQEDLRAKVDDLEQQLKILKRQLELDKETATEKSKTAPVFTAGATGFTFRSADTNFVLKVKGVVQADGRFYIDDQNRSSPNDSFLLRRVRPIFEGTLWDKFDYRLMLDFASGTTATAANVGFTQDAYVNARISPWFQIQAGKFKEPISLDRLQQDTAVVFMERSYTASLAPNRDTGVMLHGDLLENRLTYAFGVFNGVADGGSGDAETADDEKDVAARVFFDPFKNSNVRAIRGLGFGIAGSYGNQEGNTGSVLSAGQQSVFSYNPANVGTNAVTVVADGEHWRLAPQAYYYIGPFGLFGEYIISNQKVRKSFPKDFQRFQNTAWSVTGSYFLTGEDNGFSQNSNPKHPFKPSEGGWGAVELVARIQHFDADNDIFTLGYANPASSATSETTWGVGINWHLNRNIKLSLNYEDTDFKGGSSPFLLKGEKVVLTRAQLAF